MTRKIAQRRSSIHGNGVCPIDIPPAPPWSNTAAAASRTRNATSSTRHGGNRHTFLFTLNDDYVIDANVGGNIARGSTTVRAELRAGADPRPRTPERTRPRGDRCQARSARRRGTGLRLRHHAVGAAYREAQEAVGPVAAERPTAPARCSSPNASRRPAIAEARARRDAVAPTTSSAAQHGEARIRGEEHPPRAET